MKCPTCGTDGFYQGMFDADCQNPKCRHFNTKNTAPSAPTPNPFIPTKQPPTQTGGQPAVSAPLPHGIAAPAPIPGGGLAVKTLTVKILTETPKLNSVEIEFQADGDPGFPDKKVQFTFEIPGVTPKTLCTLSSRQTHMVIGIDANGTNVYTTHWKCAQDGVAPTDKWKLEATILP